MRGIIRGAVPVLLAAALAAGCSVGAPGRYRATADTCFAFGVQALRRHVTVTTVPRACAGLSPAQVNLAVARAVRDVVGPRPKAVARRVANSEGAYLARLINTVPPPRPVRPTAAPARQSARLPLGLAALAAWIATAAAGSYLLAGWLAQGSLRRRRIRGTGLPPVLVVSHFALAVTGLGIWLVFVITDVPVLAWIAAGLILLIAGLGMATLVAGLPGPTTSTGQASTGPPLAVRIAETAAPARARTPAAVIAVHGMLATATILLVLLAAIGAA